MTSEKHEEEFELGLPIEEVSDTELSSQDSEIIQHIDSLGEEPLHADNPMQESGDRRNAQHPVSDIADTCFEIQRTTERFVIPELKEIHTKLDNLHHEFQDKLKHDSHKDKIIDSLHQELQGYKDDIVKKHLKSVIMDVIKIVDDIRKLAEHYQSRKPSEDDMPKLIRHMESISSDLEDIFLWQGITPFSCDDEAFDPVRQKMLKRIETTEPAKDKKVAMRLRPGYEWEGRILRPEMVAVYVYNEVPAEFEVRDSNE